MSLSYTGLQCTTIISLLQVLELQCGLDPIYSCAAHGDNIVVCGSENGKMTIVDLRNTK